MADEEKEVAKEEPEATELPEKSKMPLVIVGVLLLLVIVGIGLVLLKKQGPKMEAAKPVLEYVVKERMYQLKDGSHLLLEFSIVVDIDKMPMVKSIIEKEAPGRLPNGINMIVGNKSREDLINGTHKREAFARELKKMLEERVFEIYNKKQTSAQEIIEVKEVLLSSLVTQSG